MSTRRRRRGWAPTPAVAALLVVVICLGVTVALIRPQPSRPLRPIVLTSSEWQPLVGAGLDDGGPVAQMVEQVFRSAGYAPSVDFTSWSTGLERVAAGEAVGAFPFTDSASRSADYLVSDPLVSFRYVLFHRAGEAPTSAAQLGRLRVARIAGYEYWPALDQAVGSYVEMPTSQGAFAALANGTVDIVPEGEVVGQAYLTGPDFPSDAAQIDHLPGSAAWQSDERQLHLLMKRTRAAQQQMADFNAALRDFQTTPAYAQLSQQVQGQRDRVLVGTEQASAWLRHADDSPLLRTPRGTRAEVLEWPDLAATPQPGKDLVRVRVLTGPASGRQVWVRLDDLELER